MYGMPSGRHTAIVKQVPDSNSHNYVYKTSGQLAFVCLQHPQCLVYIQHFVSIRDGTVTNKMASILIGKGSSPN